MFNIVKLSYCILLKIKDEIDVKFTTPFWNTSHFFL